MAGTINVSTITNGSQTATTEDIIKGTSSAWVKFNASGKTLVINGSYNVSSVTENSTGKYNVNFSKPMTNVNYSLVGSCKRTDNVSFGTDNQSVFVCPSLYELSTVHICTGGTSSAASCAINNIVVLGG